MKGDVLRRGLEKLGYLRLRQPQRFILEPALYLLLGPREDGEGEMLYIGEGDAANASSLL